MSLHESGEMYLETIYVLSKKSNTVRSLDVAEEMNFSKPSVSRAIKILKDGGFVTVDENGYLSLTESGSAVARKIYERHKVLTQFLISIGVSEETAAEDACRVEHYISDETFDALKNYSHISTDV
ncbi:MAG: metal-dependent transcriptional regulator [Lachnospiraceae bacterium]|nr:metal-dependent transcriptional regulator [Lachnospiraceae bacterium]